MKHLFDASNPHAVLKPEPQPEPTVPVRVKRTKPVLILEESDWNGGSFSCALSESDIVLVCGWGDRCEPATLEPFEMSGLVHDHGRSYRWSRTDYYVNMKNDVVPRFSSLKKMVEEDKIVIFAMPEQITEATIGRLREFAGTVMVTRQQIKDHEEALLEYRKAEDVTAPVDLRAAIAGAIEHIHQLKDKLKALYAKDLGEVPDGF